MIQRIIFALLLIFMVSGCSSLSVRLNDGTKAEYKRNFTKLDISELEITPNDDGTLTVKIVGLSTDIGSMNETIQMALDKIP